MAYGQLNLKPWEFGQLQPCQFFRMVEGYRLRMAEQDDQISYYMDLLVNAALAGKTKRRITAKQIRRGRPDPRKKNEESNKELLNDLLGKFLRRPAE